MRWFVGLLVMLTAAPALAFEGEIDARTFGDASGNDVEFAIFVSDKRDVRMDTTAKQRRGKPRRVSYIRPATGKYDFMIDHDKKQAAKVSKEAVTGLAKTKPANENRSRDDVEVEELGTATVAGQITRHVRITDKRDGEVSDFWLSDRYPATMWRNVFSMRGNSGESPANDWTRIAERQYGVKPGFIMKMVSKDKRGRESGLEVTRMEEKKVAADKFVIPPGYEVATMPDMPSGAQTMKAPTTKEEAEKMRDEWMKELQEEQR
jgi:Domain of unknown function (DUF4412)